MGVGRVEEQAAPADDGARRTLAEARASFWLATALLVAQFLPHQMACYGGSDGNHAFTGFGPPGLGSPDGTAILAITLVAAVPILVVAVRDLGRAQGGRQTGWVARSLLGVGWCAALASLWHSASAVLPGALVTMAILGALGVSAIPGGARRSAAQTGWAVIAGLVVAASFALVPAGRDASRLCEEPGIRDDRGTDWAGAVHATRTAAGVLAVASLGVALWFGARAIAQGHRASTPPGDAGDRLASEADDAVR